MASLKRNLPPLTGLVVFEAAARLGSFSDAARELNVTREAVSRQIRALEAHLGLSLFERGVNQTELRAWVRPYFSAVSSHLQAIADATQAISGEVVPGPEAPELPVADSPADSAVILVVDDVPGNIRRLYDVMGGRYEVVAHTSGQSALDWLAGGGRADLALLDVNMAGMDGYSLCRKLKAHPMHKMLPVMFLSQLDQPQDETEGFAAGGCDYIARPFVPAVLLARIDAQLELRATTAALEDLLQRRAGRLEQAEAVLSALSLQIQSFHTGLSDAGET